MRRPSAPMVISTVALFAALGGIGYATGTGGHAKSQTLESGKSLKGVYRVGDFESGAGQGQFNDAAVSYPIRLKQAPTLHFIAEAGTPPSQCPGTALNPKADPGHLCVYEQDGGSRDAGDVASSYGDSRDKLGFQVEVLSAANQGQYYYSLGTWAVTAP